MRATEFVESYFDAWNHRDPEGVADHLTSDGIYCDIPENSQRSHDELVSYLGNFFLSRQRLRYELTGNILASGNTIAYQYEIVPSIGNAKARSPGTYRGAEFITLHDDAAITIMDYYDAPEATSLSDIVDGPPRQAPQSKYAKSGLDNEQLIEYRSRLEQIMKSRLVYVRPDMTLPMLAEIVGCSVNHLSQVINAGFGMSFFDYLNQYRIAYARELLSDLDSRKRPILNIAFTVGFNSNSAFYAAFKKYVGQTPAQYRRAQLLKPR